MRVFQTFLFITCLTAAAALYSVPDLLAAPAMRTIEIEAAVSPGFESLPSWKQDFERRLAYASKIFENEFKIRFRIKRYSKWRPSDEGAPSAELLDELRSAVPLQDTEMVIGLLHYADIPKDSRRAKDLHTIGQARPFTGHLLIRYPANKLFKVQEETVLTHELGHAFGAIHADDVKSIMAPVVDKQIPSVFDAENRGIISATREIEFRNGAESLPPAVQQRLLKSYVRMARENESADFFFAMGLLYLQTGNPDGAVKAWSKAVEMQPKNAEYRYHLGALYYQKGDYARSVTALSRAVDGMRYTAQRPQLISALRMLGEAYYQQNNLFSASSAWTRAAALSPEDLKVQSNLAVLKFKQGQVTDAGRAFQKILARDPENTEARTYLGRIYAEEKGLENEALELLESVLKDLQSKPSTPRNLQNQSSVYGDIGKIYLKLGKTKNAYDHLQKSCDLTPSADCHKKLGGTLLESQQWDAAVRELASALQMQKEDPEIYGMLGTAFAKKKDTTRALSAFRDGLRYTNNPAMQARLHRNIGSLLAPSGNYQAAETEFRLAVSQNPNDIETYFGLASVQVKLNKPQQAIESLEHVLRSDPENKKAQQMISALKQTIQNTSAVTHA